MFEYHGWATLRDAANPDDSAAADALPATVDAIRRLLTDAGVNNDFQVADVRHANGQWQVWLAGYRNHRHTAVLDAWHAIGKTAPGSYGLLYVHDDEDPQRDNEWVAWAMARGRVTVHTDRFLSPYVPVIEDAEA
jgi:hypothetical protein